MSETTVIEHNVTGQDFSQRDHLVYAGPPMIDIHSHVTITKEGDQASGPAGGAGAAGSSDQAALMLDIAQDFGIGLTVSMCPVQDIAPLRERLGNRIAFNAMIFKKPEEEDEVAYRQLDAFLEAGIDILKLWSAPRGRDRGLLLDLPWRVETIRRARAAGVRTVMVHVGDPDRWFQTVYTDSAKYGTKLDQYIPLRRLMDEFNDMIWIGAHLGGDPEHPDHLEALIEAYPQIHFDTSATKWQVREVSQQRDALRSLIQRHPDRFLFGSDLVTRHALTAEHYMSRYWCQRTLWESDWVGRSPIQDPDHVVEPEGGTTPMLRGLALPAAVLQQVYCDNAKRILQR